MERELVFQNIELPMKKERVRSEREILELVKKGNREAYQEISEIVGKPMGTVMSSLYYAKKRLKVIVAKYLGFE